MRGSALSIFVEREEESEILFRRWQRARAGEGQIVRLSTGLGRGKSRLTATLLEQIAADRRTHLPAWEVSPRCSPRDQSLP